MSQSESPIPLNRFPINLQEQYDAARVVRHLQELLQTGKIDPDAVIPRLKELANTEKGDVQQALAMKAIREIDDPIKNCIARERLGSRGDQSHFRDLPANEYHLLRKWSVVKVKEQLLPLLDWVLNSLSLFPNSLANLASLTELLAFWMPQDEWGREKKILIQKRLYVLNKVRPFWGCNPGTSELSYSAQKMPGHSAQKYFEQLLAEGDFATIAYLLQNLVRGKGTSLSREEVVRWRDECRDYCFIDDFCRIQQFLGEWDGEFSRDNGGDTSFAFDVGHLGRLELLMDWAESAKPETLKERLVKVANWLAWCVARGEVLYLTDERVWSTLDRWGKCVYASMDEATAFRGLREDGDGFFEAHLSGFVKILLTAAFAREKNCNLPLDNERPLTMFEDADWGDASPVKVAMCLYLARTYFLSETRQTQIRTVLLTRAYNDVLKLPPYERALLLIKLHEVKKELDGREALDEGLRDIGVTVVGKRGEPVAGNLAPRNKR